MIYLGPVARMFNMRANTSIICITIVNSMKDSGMNSPGAAADSCNMNDGDSNKLITIMAPP